MGWMHLYAIEVGESTVHRFDTREERDRWLKGNRYGRRAVALEDLLRIADTPGVKLIWPEEAEPR